MIQEVFKITRGIDGLNAQNLLPRVGESRTRGEILNRNLSGIFFT